MGHSRVRKGDAMTTGKREAATVVMHRGVLVHGQLSVEYYTSQPAPTQWIAVGLVPARTTLGTGYQPAQMLVGSGRSEDVAVKELSFRLARLEAVALHCPAESGREYAASQEPELVARSRQPALTSQSYGSPVTLVSTSIGGDW